MRTIHIVGRKNHGKTLPVTELVTEWRKAIGVIPGVKDIIYRAEIGRGGDPIDVQLIGPEFDGLRDLSARVRERLATYPGVFDISDSFEAGKEEIKLRIRPQA